MPIALLDNQDGGTMVIQSAPPPPPPTPPPTPPPLPPAPIPDVFERAAERGPPKVTVAPPPIISPVEPPPVVTQTAAPVTTAADDGPEHRGLPQANQTQADVGPIVLPHGLPNDGPTSTGTTTPTRGHSGAQTVDAPPRPGGGGNFTTSDLVHPGNGSNRAQTATAWLRFQGFFAQRIPDAHTQLLALSKSLPKGVR